MVTLICYELYELENNNYGTKNGKTRLNPDRGQMWGNLCGTSYLGRFA